MPTAQDLDEDDEDDEDKEDAEHEDEEDEHEEHEQEEHEGVVKSAAGYLAASDCRQHLWPLYDGIRVLYRHTRVNVIKYVVW